MKKGEISMRKIIVGIIILCIIGVTSAAMYAFSSKTDNAELQITSESACREINKTLTGFIFSPEGKLVKEVPVKIIGKQYSETSLYRDYFDGKIEIDGEVIDITSPNNKAAVISDFDTQNYYLALNPDPNKINGLAENTTSVAISKDLPLLTGIHQT